MPENVLFSPAGSFIAINLVLTASPQPVFRRYLRVHPLSALKNMLSITSSPTPQISQPFARGRPGGPQQRHTISPVVCAASKEDRQNRGILNDPILEMAVREPVSFLGGIIAGFLALDVTQGKTMK